MQIVYERVVIYTHSGNDNSQPCLIAHLEMLSWLACLKLLYKTLVDVSHFDFFYIWSGDWCLRVNSTKPTIIISSSVLFHSIPEQSRFPASCKRGCLVHQEVSLSKQHLWCHWLFSVIVLLFWSYQTSIGGRLRKDQMHSLHLHISWKAFSSLEVDATRAEVKRPPCVASIFVLEKCASIATMDLI